MKFGIYVFGFSKVNLLAFSLASQEMYTLTWEAWPPRAARTSTGPGKMTLEGTNRISCAPGPGIKEQWPHRRLTQTCPWVSRSVWWGRGQRGLLRGRGTGSSSASWGLWKEVAISSTRVWPQVKHREGTQPRPSTENWIKDLLSMAPPIRTRPSFPSVSLSHQEASISLLSSPSEGRQPESQSHRKLAKLTTRTTALSDSMKLWAMPCRATQDGSWWRVLTKSDPLEKGMANHFSNPAWRIPWTVWQAKRYDTER